MVHWQPLAGLTYNRNDWIVGMTEYGRETSILKEYLEYQWALVVGLNQCLNKLFLTWNTKSNIYVSMTKFPEDIVMWLNQHKIFKFQI